MADDRLEQIAFEAYQYLYPIVLMDVTRRQAVNVPDAQARPMRAPHNEFTHYRSYPAGDSREVVRFNFDTLYSFAWLDLRDEPIVLSVPDSHGRYYLTPILDMWTDIFVVPGTRTTRGEARDFLLAAPSWTGTVPDGLEVVTAPTPVVWVMGRTQTNGPSDYPVVHAIQDGYRLTPLSAWGSDPATVATPAPVDPSVDDETAPLHQVNAMAPAELLARGAELMKLHPAHPFDYPILERLRELGFEVGQGYDAGQQSDEVRAAVDTGGRAALADLVASVTDGSLGAWSNGWMTIEGGTYGTDYRRRAMVALAGLGCNLSEDALYPGTATDTEGRPLTGEHRYRLRFSADELPQTDAFWSLTMYDKEGFQVPNEIDRFAIGDRDELRLHSDGSLEILIQRDRPAEEDVSNWLPAPDGEFIPMLRIYSPSASSLRRGVTVPGIERRVE